MENLFKKQLVQIFEQANNFINDYNKKAMQEGFLPLSKQAVRIAGQVAMLLSDLPFSVASTTDIDCVQQPQYEVFTKLDELFLDQGLHLEKDSKLIWMPPDTVYHVLCDLPYMHVEYADHRDVMRSKERFNREKDKKLIETYRVFFPDYTKRKT